MGGVPDDPEDLAAAVGRALDRALAGLASDAADLDARGPVPTPIGPDARAALDALRLALERAREHVREPTAGEDPR